MLRAVTIGIGVGLAFTLAGWGIAALAGSLEELDGVIVVAGGAIASLMSASLDARFHDQLPRQR